MPKASRTAHRLSAKPVPISKSCESEAAKMEKRKIEKLKNGSLRFYPSTLQSFDFFFLS
jgi:hypothetical protein